MKHKNSQKRIYFEDAVYFVTFNTRGWIQYFNEPIFCEAFIASLRLSKVFHKYSLYAFVILKNHAHLLFFPHQATDLSKIMQYMKRHVTRNINFILGYAPKTTEGAIGQSRLRLFSAGEKYKARENDIKKMNNFVATLKREFIKKYGANQNQFPKFRWHKSYRDHYIRNHRDFENHVKYICDNPFKHRVSNPEKYRYIFTNYPDLIES